MSDRGSAASLEAFASRWIVAAFALVGLVIGLVIFTLREPVYESQAIVSVINPLGTMGDEAALITSDRVLSPAAASLGFLPDIEVEPNDVADLLTITSRADDPDNAASAANLVAQFYEQSQTTTAVRIESFGEANPSPVSPNRMAHVLIGSLLGALIGFGASGVRSLRSALPARPRTDDEDRPAPIRPAMSPSAGLSTLAEPTDVDTAQPIDRALDPRGIDPDHGPLLDLRGDHATVTPAGMAPPTSVDATEPASEWTSVAPPERPPVSGSEDVRILGPAGQSQPSAGAPRSTAFSSAASSMVARPPAPTSSWRTGPEPVLEAPETPPAPARVAPGPVAPQPVPPQPSNVEPAPPTAQQAPVPQPVQPQPEPQRLIADVAADNPTSEPHRSSMPAASSPIPADDDLPTDVDAADLFDDLFVDPTPVAASDDQSTPRPQQPRPAPRTSQAADPAKESMSDLHDGIRFGLDAERELEDMTTRYEARINDLVLEHTETLGNVEADFERQLGDLKRELADARKQARVATAQVKRLSGNDQHRIGDLEAQAEALEAEIGTLRGQLETERIAHVRELTNERDAADRALDNARREFRDQVESVESLNRRSMAESRGELDDLLASSRAEHQAALDRQHAEYDEALTRERERHKADLARLTERHRDELAKTRSQAEQETERQLRLTKQTIGDLRTTEKRMTAEIEELRQAERQYRAELTNVRKQGRYAEQKRAETEQTLRDELAVTKKSLTAEKERNAALRDDVVRRTAEAHQAVDRAIEDRSAQLAELESLVAKHRQHAEERVREATASAEERARESARREAELTARITRLERELDEVRRQTG